MIQLRKYQLDYMMNVLPNWIYFLDTGLGKTIMGLEHHKRFFSNCKLLIVAPASKLNEGGWQRTIKEHYPNITYDTCSYHMLAKKWMNYSNYFVIFDECHRLKNSTGKWGLAGFNLTKIAIGFILLSATPIPNGWEDAINYFKMFGLAKNKTTFLKDHAITTNYNGYLEILSWKHEPLLNKMWHSISRYMGKEEAIDLPELSFKDIMFKPSSKYKRILKDRVYNDVMYDNQMKLRHGLRLYTNLDAKKTYIGDFIESTTDNILIFYNYDEELEVLQDIVQKPLYICNGHTKKYPKKDEWGNIKNSVTIANYKSGSEAVEFTYCNIIIYFSPTDSYTEFFQSYGRCYRSGQNKKVTVYKFITKSTIEENIYKALNNKQDFNIKLWEKENLNND